MRNISKFYSDTIEIFWHELRLLAYSPSTYLFQSFFLALLFIIIFLVADFMSTDDSSINLLLTFFPWIAVILVPALVMRLWPDNNFDRSVELVMTLPLGTGAIVLGKFLAAYFVLFLTLISTFPFLLTISYLGNPDYGVMLSGYIGLALLLFLYCSIAIFFTSLINEPIGSFISSLGFLFILLFLGWDVFGRFLKQNTPPGLIELLALYSPVTWLTQMGQGLVKFGGVLYFVFSSLGALVITYIFLEIKRRQRSTSFANKIKKFALVSVFIFVWVGLIPIIESFSLKLDLSEGREFSLNSATIEILKKLPNDTTVTLYWSSSETSVPVNIKLHARRISSVIKEMISFSENKIIYRELEPLPDSDHELRAISHGLRRVPMTSGDSFMLGLTIIESGRVINIPYFDIRRAQLLEYDLALAFNGFTKKKAKRIGLLSPLIPPRVAFGNREGMSFIGELKRAYDLAIIPHFKDSLPEGLDVLIVIDATILRKELLLAIDQFVMKGGKLIVMVDPYVRFNKASNIVIPKPSIEVNDISDLLLAYGLKFNNNVVGDMSVASIALDREQQRVNYPFWMRLRAENFSTLHPTTASLNEVFFAEGGYFEIVSNFDSITSLLKTSGNSGVIERGRFSNNTPRKLALSFLSDQKQRTLAAHIGGSIRSAFGKDVSAGSADNFRNKSDGNPQVFAIADVDWVFDPFSVQSVNIGGETVVRPLNDNLTLLLNIIEYASGESSLISIRSRGKIQRPFNAIQSLIRNAEEKFHLKEVDLNKKAERVEEKISKIFKNAGTKDLSRLPINVREELLSFRDELLQVRSELREVRFLLRSDVDFLSGFLALLNILSGPLISLLFAVIIFSFRGRSYH